MEWNRMENGMEGEFCYGIWKMLRMERNGRFENWNGRSSTILTTFRPTVGPVYQNLQQITENYQTRMRIISHFAVLQGEFLACCDCIVLLR